jgi:hypothetical protein
MFFPYIVVEVLTVCMEAGRKDIFQVVFCMVILKATSVNTKHHITLDHLYITVRVTPLAEHI